jgi:hypothetical protein
MPLVYAFNRALEALREIDVPLRESTRESTDLLLFHRNDPKYMFATHNSHSSKRKPDLILVSLRAANEASSDGQGSWADRAFGKAGERPKKGFKWSECLCGGNQMDQQTETETAARKVYRQTCETDISVTDLLI